MLYGCLATDWSMYAAEHCNQFTHSWHLTGVDRNSHHLQAVCGEHYGVYNLSGSVGTFFENTFLEWKDGLAVIDYENHNPLSPTSAFSNQWSIIIDNRNNTIWLWNEINEMFLVMLFQNCSKGSVPLQYMVKSRSALGERY